MKPFFDMLTRRDAQALCLWWRQWISGHKWCYSIMTSPSNPRFWALYRIERKPRTTSTKEQS